ncbi:MAG TPA: endonuclease IV, partial [Clostridiales bacterium UBA8960]|nr:endonuclease IV [Clostridiales bacterium UBA8960]
LHLSVTKGYHHMGKEALSIGADTFQFFTRNPRGGSSKAIDEKDVSKLIQLMEAHKFGPILAHAPYTLNPCSADERVKQFAFEVLTEDLEKLESLPGTLYNFHPGSHVGQGVEKGIALIVELLNRVMKETQSTIVLLETMSGKGSEVGSRFEELKKIIDQVNFNDKLGVCLDTCHVYDAGYDIVGDLDGVLETFDRIIGLDKLYAIHLNDTKNPFNSHKDRHEKIGEGHLGIEAIQRIINHPKLIHLPFYLETPNELPGYAEEIALLTRLNEKG